MNTLLGALSDAVDKAELLDVIGKIAAIEQQMANFNRDGAIRVLLDARRTAPKEIFALENVPGAVGTPISEIPDERLFEKLPVYRQGLINHCMKKCELKLVVELVKRELRR